MNKFIVSRNLLSLALSIAKKALVKNPAIPAIENFLIDVADGFLTISATDLTTTVHARVRCESHNNSPFSVVVPKKLFDYISELEDQPLAFELKDDLSLTIVSCVDTVRFKCEAPENFPRLAIFEKELNVEATSEIFQEMHNQLIFMHTDSLFRANLCGAHFAKDADDRFTMTSTNLHIIRSKHFSSNGYHLDKGFTVNSSTVKLLASFKDKKTQNKSLPNGVGIRVKDELVSFSFPDSTGPCDIQVVGRLITNDYPDWGKALPLSFSTEFTGSVLDTVKLISRAEAILDGQDKTISIEFKENGIMAVGAETQNANVNYSGLLSGEMKGDLRKIGFRVNYLKPVLALVAAKNFQIKIGSGLGLAIIEDDNVKMVIAPCNL